jgi:hypothetical protein
LFQLDEELDRRKENEQKKRKKTLKSPTTRRSPQHSPFCSRKNSSDDYHTVIGRNSICTIVKPMVTRMQWKWRTANEILDGDQDLKEKFKSRIPLTDHVRLDTRCSNKNGSSG